MESSILSGSSRRTQAELEAILVELLVAVLIASLLLTFFFHADITVRQSVFRWASKSSLEETALLLRQRLEKDLVEIDSVAVDRKGNLKLMLVNGRIVEYDFSGNSCRRNGELLLPNETRLTDFTVTDLAGQGRQSFENSAFEPLKRSGFLLTLDLQRGKGERCHIVLPVRPWKYRHLIRGA